MERKHISFVISRNALFSVTVLFDLCHLSLCFKRGSQTVSKLFRCYNDCIRLYNIVLLQEVRKIFSILSKVHRSGSVNFCPRFLCLSDYWSMVEYFQFNLLARQVYFIAHHEITNLQFSSVKDILLHCRICLHIQTFVIGDDERGRTLRRSAARYINLAQVLVLRDISTAVKKRFPTLDHLVEGGFLTEDEHKQYEKIDMNHHKFWLPLQWTCSLLAKARKESKIEADATLVRMIEEILNIRNSLANLLCYDWISVPLVYTQVCF